MLACSSVLHSMFKSFQMDQSDSRRHKVWQSSHCWTQEGCVTAELVLWASIKVKHHKYLQGETVWKPAPSLSFTQCQLEIINQPDLSQGLILILILVLASRAEARVSLTCTCFSVGDQYYCGAERPGSISSENSEDIKHTKVLFWIPKFDFFLEGRRKPDAPLFTHCCHSVVICYIIQRIYWLGLG